MLWSVAVTGELERGLRYTLHRCFPTYYAQYTSSDFPDLSQASGILLCRGTIFLRAVGCKFTHAAILDRGHVYQATDEGGVITQPFDIFVSSYLHVYNRISFLALSPSLDSDTLVHLFGQLQGRPYKESLAELVKARFDANKLETTTSLFCSELVALLLQELGVLVPDDLANNYLPDSFLAARLMPGYTLTRRF